MKVKDAYIIMFLFGLCMLSKANGQSINSTIIIDNKIWYSSSAWLGETEEVKLTGKLTIEAFYGPPNYGESPLTDTIERYYFLIPDNDIIIEIGNERTRIKKIQIEIGINNDFISEIYNTNKKYCVYGTLFFGHTGHHHTDILISLNKIEML
ncbi:hypothetical protein FACS1894147_05610 [Spirochaetia bacterium]|nr:hypothetical protein FACS1894147_05610 [Spirochaetia bacterium]